MAKKEKEEERNERIIRGLLKLPENRRCINCNSLGPQYVCSTFWTFVCTNCSGIHREFTHRIKSVSMAKFNEEEVSSLQGGGNERARQIYFKTWDPQRNSYPDVSNLHRLRDFIKHVYVDRKYTGEASHDRIPRLRLSNKEEAFENRKAGLYQGGYRSPSYGERNEGSEKLGPVGRSSDKGFRYIYDERRSPRYDQENSRYGGFKRSPTRFVVVDDRFRDDGIQNGRHSDCQRFSDREPRFEYGSTEHQNNRGLSSPPVVRPVKDILGENVLPLQVGECSKTTDGKGADGSAHNQMIASSRRVASREGNPVQHKSKNSESLIDLTTDSKASDDPSAAQTQENQSSCGGKSSSRESSAKNTPPAPKPNTLEFLLFELSVPPAVPVDDVSEVLTYDNSPSTVSRGNLLKNSSASAAVSPAQMLTLPNSVGTSIPVCGGNLPACIVTPAMPGGQESLVPYSGGAPTATSGGNMLLASASAAGPAEQMPTASGTSMIIEGAAAAVPVQETLSFLDSSDASTTPPTATDKPSNGDPPQTVPGTSCDLSSVKVSNAQIPSFQHHQPSLPASSVSPHGQHQLCTSLTTPNARGPSNELVEYSSQVSKPDQDSNSRELLPLEIKSIGRKELPADLFTASYIPASAPFVGSPYTTGVRMQYYPNPAPVPAYRNCTTSINPFNLSRETTSIHESPFPSTGNLRSALPTVSAPGVLSQTSSFCNNSSGMETQPGTLVRTSSFGNNSSGLVATQPSTYLSTMPSHSHSFASAISSGAYMGQLHMNTTYRPQGANGFSSGEVSFSSLEMTQHPVEYSTPTSQNSLLSKGGNPFG